MQHRALNGRAGWMWPGVLAALALTALACSDNNTEYAAQTADENNGDPANNGDPVNNGEPVNNNEPVNNSEPVNNASNNDTPANNGSPPGAANGEPCAEDAACAGGTCLPAAEDWPEGYCTQLECATGQTVCADGSQCAFFDATRESSGCFARCDAASPCREGYMCQALGDVSLCLPEPPELRPDGAACTSREQCLGGACLTDEDGFFEGMCTTLGCETRVDCQGEDTACLQAGRPNYCIALCQRSSDCRAGYFCQEVGGGDGYCAPSPTAGTNVPREGDLPFAIQCGDTLVEQDAYRGGYDRHELRFSIPAGTTSFVVVPYTDGTQIFPVELEGPAGSLDMQQEYGFAAANASFLYNLTPILVPQAPEFADFVQPGDYTLTMAADSDLCFYVVPKSAPGAEIDLNIHLVGAGGITAASAPRDTALQTALRQFNTIYGQLDVQIGDIRYIDVTGDPLTRYRIVRTEEAAFRLVALSEEPGESADALLSVNVFFVDDFAIDGGAVLGISAGLPGAPGLHGARGSGLVFSAAVLDDPTLLGQVLAHEVGHFLGLFHTSEQGGQGFDPIDDTARCEGRTWGNPNNCPDLTNLMFPFAGLEHVELSDGQALVLQANPLVK